MGVDIQSAEATIPEAAMHETVRRIMELEKRFPSHRAVEPVITDDPGWSVDFLPDTPVARIRIPREDILTRGPDSCESLYLHERLHPEVSGEVLKHFTDGEWDTIGFAFGVNVVAEDNRNEFSGNTFIPGGTAIAGRHLLEDIQPGHSLDFALDDDPARLSSTVLADIGYIPAHMRLAAASRAFFCNTEIAKTMHTPSDTEAFTGRLRAIDPRVADAFDRIRDAIGEYYHSVPADTDAADIAEAGKRAADIYRQKIWPELQQLTDASIVDHAMVLYADSSGSGPAGQHRWTPRDAEGRAAVVDQWIALAPAARRKYLDEAADTISKIEEAICAQNQSHANTPESAVRKPDTGHSIDDVVEELTALDTGTESGDALRRYVSVAQAPETGKAVAALLEQMRIREQPEWIIRTTAEGEELDMDAFLDRLISGGGDQNVYATRELEATSGALTGVESATQPPGGVNFLLLGDISKTATTMRDALQTVAVIQTEYGAQSGSNTAVAVYTADTPGFEHGVVRVLKPFTPGVQKGRRYAVSESEKRAIGRIADREFGGGSSPLSTAMFTAAERLIGKQKKTGLQPHTFMIVVTDGIPTDYRPEFLPNAGGRPPTPEDIETAQIATAKWMRSLVTERLASRGIPVTILCLGVGPGTERINQIMPQYPPELRTAISRVLSARGRRVLPSEVSWSFADVNALVAAFPVITEYALSRPNRFRR